MAVRRGSQVRTALGSVTFGRTLLPGIIAKPLHGGRGGGNVGGCYTELIIITTQGA